MARNRLVKNDDKKVRMKRNINYIDVYKGISILCITLLHYEDGIFPTWLNVFIGSFMITAFYLTSGWLTGLKDKQPTTKELIRKRLKSLGAPYLWFTIIFLGFDFVLYLFNYYDITFLAREVYKSITLRGIGTLWFLPALFFGEILLSFILSKRWWWQLLAVAIALAYTHGYGYWSANFRNLSDMMQIIDAPFKTIDSASSAFIVLLYSYYASVWYKNNIKNGVAMPLKLLLMVMLLGIYFWFAFNPISVPLAGVFIGASLLFGMFLFSYFVSKVPIINSFFIFWGKNSLIMMVTHYTIIQVLCEITNKYILGNAEFTGYITLVFFVLTVLIEYPVVYLLNKKGAFILGRN